MYLCPSNLELPTPSVYREIPNGNAIDKTISIVVINELCTLSFKTKFNFYDKLAAEATPDFTVV
jgi:hypothetical protein